MTLQFKSALHSEGEVKQDIVSAVDLDLHYAAQHHERVQATTIRGSRRRASEVPRQSKAQRYLHGLRPARISCTLITCHPFVRLYAGSISAFLAENLERRRPGCLTRGLMGQRTDSLSNGKPRIHSIRATFSSNNISNLESKMSISLIQLTASLCRALLSGG